MTQWDLAGASGVGWASIARIETGRQDPTLGMIERLAEGLGVSPLELLSDAFAPGRRSKTHRTRKTHSTSRSQRRSSR